MARYYSIDALAGERLTTIRCPVCDATRAALVATDNGYRITRCNGDRCGFVFVNPRPNSEQLERFYAGFYDGDADVPAKWEREMGPIFREVRDWLVDSRSSGRVLDVGCSFGHFPRMMERAGWRTVGVEPSPVAAEHARSTLAGEVLTQSFEDVDLDAESFDAVVSLYVLEHVADPRGFMEKVHRLLCPGGMAVIRIPFTAPLFPMAQLLKRPLMYAPMHLNDFSPETMERLCRDIGFRSVEVRVGARRRAHDLVENVGAFVLGGVGRAVEIVTQGRARFPFVGAMSYRIVK